MITIESYYSGSEANCYLVKNGDTTILLECGIEKDILINDILWQKNRLNISKLDGCIISHIHNDHSGIRYNTINKVNEYINIYSCEEVYRKYNFKGNILNNNENFKIGSINIKPISVYHGKSEKFAFIFKDNDNKIFWGTDFSFMYSNLNKFKFNTIFIEINYIDELINNKIKIAEQEEDNSKLLKYKRQMNTHMSLDNCINLLSNWDLTECGEIIAIHISKDVGNRELIKKTIEDKFNIPCYCANHKGGY